MRFWKDLFSKKRKKKYEYLYLFSLPTVTFAHKDSGAINQGDSSLRVQLLHFIKADLRKHQKGVKDSDVFINTADLETYFFFASDDLKINPFLTPLLYEIYAFKTKKDTTLFTYPMETLLFKSHEVIKVLKFTIEC